MSQRIQRKNQLIKKELSQILLKEFDFQRNILVTLTRVETSVSLSDAKAYISIIPEQRIKEIVKILNQNSGQIRRKIGERLKIRIIPKIRFIEETKIREAARIDELLDIFEFYKQIFPIKSEKNS